MPIFETAIQQVSSAVGTVSGLVFDPSNTSATTYGPLGSVPSGAVIKGIQLINQGTSNAYVGMGSAASASVTGWLLPAGATMYMDNYSAAGGVTTGRIFANTGTVGLTTAILAGLPSVASVI